MKNSYLGDVNNKALNKAGIDIEEMKKAAESGKIEEYLNKNLSENATKKLKSVLSNKEATEKLMSTPQAKELMKKLTKGK